MISRRQVIVDGNIVSNEVIDLDAIETQNVKVAIDAMITRAQTVQGWPTPLTAAQQDTAIQGICADLEKCLKWFKAVLLK